MDQLLLDLQNVSTQLLPILGAVVLIFLCIFLKKLWQLIESITATVKGLDPTLKQVYTSIEKVQAPLDTAVKYSHSLDKVHDKTVEAFGKAADFASENIDNLKTVVQDKLKKEEEAIEAEEGESA
ncbi:MAG: hypothetical protein K6A40_06330 [Solobacterium sp.]|nr:hypothetical protein [Solobacterium sp.]